MGCLCSCFGDQTSSQPTQKTPLLSGQSGLPVTSQDYVPSYARAGQQNAGITVDTPPPHSARQHRPNVVKKQELLTSLDHVAPVSLVQLPAQLAPLNKTFQDHGKLYNDLYGSFKDLRQSLNDFKGKFLQETAGIPVMADCLSALSTRCGGAKLTAKREKRCIQLEYDAREVSEKCTGPPEDCLEALELYNKINRLVKSILEKAPQVSTSLGLVLEDETKLKREVTKSDLSPSEGPEAMRACTDNINRLRKLPTFIDTIQKYTDKIFKEVLEGSKKLLNNSEQSS